MLGDPRYQEAHKKVEDEAKQAQAQAPSSQDQRQGYRGWMSHMPPLPAFLTRWRGSSDKQQQQQPDSDDDDW